LTVFCSALAWAATAWVQWLFPGFGSDVLPLGVLLVRIHLAAVPIAAASAVLAVLFQARQQFGRVESISLGLNVLLVGALHFLLPAYGIEAAAWAYASRWALHTLCLVPVLRGGRLSAWPGGLRALWHRAAPLMAGNAYFKTDVLVDRHLLSMADAGALSLFALAQSLWSIVAGVIGQSLGNTAMPVLTAAAQRQDPEAFRTVLRKRLRLIAWVSVAAALLVVVLAPPVLELLTRRLLVSDGQHALWMLLAALVGVPVFGGMGALVAGSFYALGDTKTPTLISAVTFSVMIACKIWVFREFGVLALCLVTTIYYAVNQLAMMHALRLRMRTSLPS
jgi:putative peptidoglycan lipid II flippase